MSYHTNCVWFFMFWGMTIISFAVMAHALDLYQDHQKAVDANKKLVTKVYQMWQRYVLEVAKRKHNVHNG